MAFIGFYTQAREDKMKLDGFDKIREDKFEVGDLVTWDHQFLAKHIEGVQSLYWGDEKPYEEKGPFKIKAVEPIERIMQVFAGHTQQITLDVDWEFTEFTGAFFRKVQLNH
jgi:hypothetical protein